ncbi:MAG: nuclear transport factor 2 family protein [Sphingomonadales bacterium]
MIDINRTAFALLAALSMSNIAVAQNIPAPVDEAALAATITALDAKVFDAYNKCDLKAFEGYFAPNVEFYHDKGGATFDRATVVSNTQKYICHKVRRELVPGTLHIYPIKDFGAVEEGEHRFCQIGGVCEGAAKFLMIWQKTGDNWVMTRVVSYGHRPLTDADKKALQP